jgi:hypothetical protein
MTKQISPQEIDFKPTLLMKEAMRRALDPSVGPTITAYMEAAGSDQSVWYKWLKKEGFHEWWLATWKDGMARHEPYFDKIGMIKGSKDHKYWRDMQTKYYKFTERAEQTGDGAGKIVIEFRNAKPNGDGNLDGPTSGEAASSVIDII